MTLGADIATIRHTAEAAGQGHVLRNWDSLSDYQQSSLLRDIQAVDFEHLRHAFASSQAIANESLNAVSPASDVTTLKDMTQAARASATQAGHQMIAEGRMGVLLLAGGQGTRLGSTAPKGCYDIGLPSKTPLFGLQAHRIRRLQELSAQVAGQSSVTHPMHWYIMTSPATDAPTQEYFTEMNFFGLQASQVHFFQQGQMPCITEGGKLILAEPHRLAWAPDGNGGLYNALRRHGLLEHMATNGVDALDCVSVDNALVSPGDPLFIGHCQLSNAQCGAKVVAKAYPEEKVGVFAMRGQNVSVVEYSELGADLAEKRDPSTGQLLYNWSNVCMHYFRRDFLESVAMRLHTEGHFHIAHKSIPSDDGPVKGIKLELFIFDTFPMASKVVLMEAARDSQFAPVKNKEGQDSPATARAAVLAQHTRWVCAAGGTVDKGNTASRDEGVVEVSPLLSYGGEGLEEICNGKSFSSGAIIGK